MDNNLNEEELRRREIRRKRRIKNQLLAYITLLVILAAIGTGGYFGVIKIMTMVSEYDERVESALKEAQKNVTEVALE